MKKKLLITVGNGMMGDDAAGPLLAQKIRLSPPDDWEVLNGGNVPENHLHQIREMAPEKVVIVDAADMALQTGEIRLIDESLIGNVVFMTTHSLPLTYLIESIKEFVPSVDLIGIQPGIMAFGYPVSPQVTQAVDRIYTWLKQNEFEIENLRPVSMNQEGDSIPVNIGI
jgi:hydrogenase 3 maturation protease